MKNINTKRSLKIAILAAAMTIASTCQCLAGETSVYLKTGWFNWDETVNGNSFVKEKGLMHAAGVSRKDTVFGNGTISELVEVWGGNPDYDGHDVTGATQVKSSTSYLGTREEIIAGVRLPAGQKVTFEPFAGMGHKFWIRTRSSEDWNVVYAKAGLGAEVKACSSATFFAKGGALAPIFTRTHVTLSDAGYSDVVTRPKSELSAFAEGGVKMGRFAVSVEYEGMKFGESNKVATNKTGVQSGVVIQNSQAYQPDSEASLVSLKIAYSF